MPLGYPADVMTVTAIGQNLIPPATCWSACRPARRRGPARMAMETTTSFGWHANDQHSSIRLPAGRGRDAATAPSPARAAGPCGSRPVWSTDDDPAGQTVRCSSSPTWSRTRETGPHLAAAPVIREMIGLRPTGPIGRAETDAGRCLLRRAGRARRGNGSSTNATPPPDERTIRSSPRRWAYTAEHLAGAT